MIETAVGRDADPATVTIEDLENIIARWRGVSPTTAHNRIVAWRQFFQWGRRRYGWPDPTDNLDLPRNDSPALRRLTLVEVNAMLDANVDEITGTAVWILGYLGIRNDE